MKSISMIPMQSMSKDSGMVVGKVVGICFMGSDDAVEHSVLLQELIGRYIGLFVKLYPKSAVPKLHQLMHLIDNIAYLRKLLSCFVTERKHRATKRAALFVFRHIDNTVIKDCDENNCENEFWR